MNLARRWQRIFILSVLALSVSVPMVLFFHRLNTLSFIGRDEFIEDFNSIKHSTDALKLSAVELEAEEGLREPPLVVYKDGHFNSVVTNTSNQILGSGESISGRSRINLVEKNGTDEDKRENQQSLSASEGKQKQLNQTTTQHSKIVRSPSPRPADEMVMRMKDQLARAKVYLQFSTPSGISCLLKVLRQQFKDVEQALGEATRDSELPRSARQKMRGMENTLAKASLIHIDCSNIATKLRAMTYKSEEQVRTHKNQVSYLVQLAARTTPKGLHCLNMRLTSEYFTLEPKKRKLPNQHRSLDADFHHFVVFSDNVLACAVVVNSTVSNTMEPKKVVFHVVTDSLNVPAISMWFLLNPPGEATIQVQSTDKLIWSSDDHYSRFKKQSYHGPRYISPSSHLYFYLPDIFSALNKIVLLEHDVVVQRDLAGLWGVNMKGKVVGAVETCQKGESSFSQMDMFINFSDPIVAKKFDSKACTWAFGMNVFDLQAWRRRKLTDLYHKYLDLGLKRPLWKPGSLALVWVTFYSQTVALDRGWLARGLGSDDSSVERHDIESAAVIHYNGIMKPWLDIDIGFQKHKGFWSKFVSYDHPYLQQCNIHQ